MTDSSPRPETPPPGRADRSDTLSWRPLRFLTLYRLTLAGLLFSLFFLLPETRGLGSQSPWLYAATSLLYLVFALVAGFTARLRRPGFRLQVFIQVCVDILAIVLLMQASGGLASGLGILLLLAVVAGGLLLPGRLAFFFAALSTLLLFLSVAYNTLQIGEIPYHDMTRAGILGLALFTVATLAHVLGKRVRESEALAEQRGVDLANLARLNEYIVQRLQAGLVVVDETDRIRLLNDTVWVMLQLTQDRDPSTLKQISPELAEQLRAWRSNPDYEPQRFTPPASQVELQPRFMQLGNIRGAATLILLEDTAQLAQQAQQMKLAAIGRLSANIAHEIRNPLGAISHATQLLQESGNLDGNDQRLLDIVRRHAARVNDIVENVLQLSRRGAAHPQQVLVADWLNEFVEDALHCDNLHPDNIQVDVEPVDLRVSFDPGHLHQLIWNLIQNACLHARQEQPLLVRLEARMAANGQPYLDIIDNGPGVDAETLGQIFEPFYTTSTQGTGLGLYLARELAETNGARLNYLDRPETGSCFRISFSRQQES